MILTAFKSGISQAWRYRKIILIVYVLTLTLAALVAIPFKGLLESKAGHSLIVKDLVKGFDYTFLNDFLQNYGEGFLPILDQSILVAGLYFVFMVFLMGGIVKVLVDAPVIFDRSLFWGAAGQYFWRMIRLTFYFLIIHALVLGVFVFLFLQITKGMSPAKLDSEVVFMDTINTLGPIYFLVGAFFFMWQDYAKLFMVRNDNNLIFKPMLASLRFVINNFRKTYGLFLLNLLFLIILIYINYLLSKLFDIQSLSTIVWTFALSQMFIICRLFLKLARLGSEGWISESSLK